MKYLVLTVLFCLFMTPTLQAQRLEKPSAKSNKSVKENMYRSKDYKALVEFLKVNDAENAMELTNKLLEDYRNNDSYLADLHFIAGNLHYSNKVYSTAYTHYETARRLVNPQSDVARHLQDAVDRTLYQVNRVAEVEKNLITDKLVTEVQKVKDSITPNKGEETQAFAVIENVPIYPGCDKLPNNYEQKNCMSTSITKHINENFDTGLANKLNLEGRQEVNLRFTIDKEGKVVKVDAKGFQPNIELEAIRVIKLLPDMKPGTQRGKPVSVMYGLPIIFQVQ